MIRFERVTKEYRSPQVVKTILRDFTGEFPAGRNVALIGKNGAGKSTVIKMISGTEFPDSGRIRRRGRISFPLGFAGSFKGSLSGRENCRFVARIYGLPTKKVEAFVEDFAEIGKYFDMPFGTYSSGMRSRVAFGVSMAVDFDCYLIDETLSVGDATFRARCAAAFAERRARASLIMVSHSMNMLKQYCDMGAVLANGKMQLYDKLDDAIEVYQSMIGKVPVAAATGSDDE